MPYWLILPAFAVTWIAIWVLKTRVEAMSYLPPLQCVYDFHLRFTNRLIEVLKLTPEEYEHLKPVIENPIHLKIEFWRGHLVLFVEAEGAERTPWPVYVRSSAFVENPLKIWKKRFAEGEDELFLVQPPIPTLQFMLTENYLQLAAVNGRFGQNDSFDPKPENVFMKISMSRAHLDEYQDRDPDAYYWRPGNMSEYNNEGKDELVSWHLRVFTIDTRDRYMS